MEFININKIIGVVTLSFAMINNIVIAKSNIAPIDPGTYRITCPNVTNVNSELQELVSLSKPHTIHNLIVNTMMHSTEDGKVIKLRGFTRGKQVKYFDGAKFGLLYTDVGYPELVLECIYKDENNTKISLRSNYYDDPNYLYLETNGTRAHFLENQRISDDGAIECDSAANTTNNCTLEFVLDK